MLRPALLLPLCAVLAAAAPPGGREAPLREAVWGGRWLEGVRLYGELERSGAAPSPQASYLAGFAEWKLRRPEAARPLLKKAAEAGFRAGARRPQPGALLARVDAYLALRPPKADVPGLDASAIDAYAGPRTPRTGPILDALPRIAALGRRLFGAAPPVRFLLFARAADFSRLYEVLDDSRAGGGAAAHSTGGVNMVLFCEEKARRATTDETVSLALHETMHAWAATYLRDTYDRPILLPTYVDEGLATYAAGLWSPAVAALPARRLADWRRRGFEAPPLDALRRHVTFFAGDRVVANYFLSEQLIERLIGPPEEGAGKVKAFLDAYARTGDDLRAWREVSGKDAAAEYAALAAGE